MILDLWNRGPNRVA